MLKLPFVKKTLPFVGIVILICFAMFPYVMKMIDENMGQKLVFTMYDFHPMEMIEQNERIKELFNEDIADNYLLSNDTRQLNVYLRFEMKPAKPRILRQNGKQVIFTIEGGAMSEENQIFLIEFTHSWGKITSMRESALFPIPPSGIWDYEYQNSKGVDK